jgi:hypothetical protein
MTEPTQDLAARRREIVRAVADLSEQHDLPMPGDIYVSGRDCVTLRMDEDDREGVVRWTAATSNGAVETTEPMGGGKNGGHRFVSVMSDRWSHSAPTWLGVSRLNIWSACDVPEDEAS